MDIKTVMTSAIVSAVVTSVAVPVVNYVTLQAGSPGTPQAGHINVTGNALAGRVGVNTSPTLARLQVNETGGLQGVRSISSTGVAVYGQSNATTGLGAGGYFTSASSGGRALVAEQFGASGPSVAGLFMNNSTSGVGVSGRAKAISGATVGVYGETASTAGVAGRFKSTVSPALALLGVSGGSSGTFTNGSAQVDLGLASGEAGMFKDGTNQVDLANGSSAGVFTNPSGFVSLASTATCADFQRGSILGYVGGDTAGFYALVSDINGTVQTALKGAATGNADNAALVATRANQGLAAGMTSDSLLTNGAIPRHIYNGTPASMVPVAYGYVTSVGGINSGTNNFTVTRSALGHYDIDVLGVSGNFQSFILVANAIAADGKQWASIGPPSGSGDIGVSIGDLTTGDINDSDFTFVLYRVAGTASPPMPQNVVNPPQFKAFGGPEEWERADPRGFKEWADAYRSYELAYSRKAEGRRWFNK